MQPAGTMASWIANGYQGANPGLGQSSLIYLAAILLVISLIVNLARAADHPPHRGALMSVAAQTPGAPRPSRLQRRRRAAGGARRSTGS